MTQPVEDRWVVTAPQDIDFTPAEIAQIAEALRHLTTALPGRTPMVVLAQRRSDTRLGIYGGAVVKEIVLPDREAPPSVEDRLRGAIYEASNYYRATKIVCGHGLGRVRQRERVPPA